MFDMEWNEVTAGVQAGGSILAIAVAIYLSRMDAKARRKDAEEDRNRRAAAFAAQMMVFVVHIINRLDFIDRQNVDKQYGLEAAMFDAGNTVILFSVSPAVDRAFMRDLGALPIPIIQEAVALIAVVDDYDPYIQSSMPLARSMDGHQRAAYLDDMHRRVEGMRKGAAFLKPHLEALMDRVG
jgi:hypothetical protein